MALSSLETGGEPDDASFAVTETDSERLLTLLTESHRRLLTYLSDHYRDAPLDTVIALWGDKRPLCSAVPYLSSEDHYHAGQVAFIRLATDPAWDYYSFIYGAE